VFELWYVAVSTHTHTHTHSDFRALVYNAIVQLEFQLMSTLKYGSQYFVMGETLNINIIKKM